MLGWRESIIQKIKYQQSTLFLIHDEDYLLNDEYVLKKLQNDEFDIIRFEDSITFRYLYEQQYRGNDSANKLVIYTNENVIFPYEFKRKALSVKIDIQTVFPKFSSQVVRQIDREDLDTLHTVHQQYQGTPSEGETLEYLVRFLYKIPYEVIDTEADLYKILLSIHYQTKQIPSIVQEFLFNKWKGIPAFKELPLMKLVSSQSFFYRFLEQKWANLINRYIQVETGEVNDSYGDYNYDPLANRDVRRLMNDLFLEGQLAKVKGISIPDAMPNWMYIGIEKGTNQDEIDNHLKQLKQKINDCLASISHYRDWMQVSRLIAEFIQISKHGGNDLNESEKLLNAINDKFIHWMVNQYHTLTSLPPYPKPKFVHHIPHAISSERNSDEKIALLVLDGMSFIQWRTIKSFLEQEGFLFDEHQVFAWVPTLTSVSRQAIFSGNIPLTFSQTIHTTSAEEKLWKSFWENQGVLKQYVAYQRSLGNEEYDPTAIKALKKKSIKIYGAVIDIIDKFTHHAVLGEKSVTSNLSLWLESNYLVNLLSDLINTDYTVYLTSDHGNTNAAGIGRVSEGVLVDQKGERVRVYNDKNLYEDAASKLSVIKWPSVGLPDNYNVLLAEYGQAFVPKNQSIVTHGGISIEEVIVPFVKVQKYKGSGLGE